MRNWKCLRADGKIVDGTSIRKFNHWTRDKPKGPGIIFNDKKELLQYQSMVSISPHPNLNRYTGIFIQVCGKLIWSQDYCQPSLFQVKRMEDTSLLMSMGKMDNVPFKNFKDKMRRMRWDKPAPTIVAHLAKDGYMFIHPFHDRTITVREAARFQSFPDGFEFCDQ